MPQQPTEPPLEIRQSGDVTVVQFTCPMLWGLQLVQAVGERLYRLVDEGQTRIVLNLQDVQSMDSSMLGKLIGLHKKTEEAAGRLAICQFHPELYATFETLKLVRLLHIYPMEEEALRSF
jgi:anti-anti-sigma factor